MKKVCTSDWWLLQTTLALMLLLVVMACENDEPQPLKPLGADITLSAGSDINTILGDSVYLRPLVSYNPPEVVVSWKFLEKPDGSTVNLRDLRKPNTAFLPDLAGRYSLEITVSNDQKSDSDTLSVTAFAVTPLNGSYDILYSANGQISKLFSFNNRLYAVGAFTKIDGVIAFGIASFDGNAWSPLTTGLESDMNSDLRGTGINDLIEYQDEIYITGSFSTPGGINSEAIARWDGTSWKSVPGVPTYYNEFGHIQYTYHGYSFEIFQDKLYIGGWFQADVPGTEIPNQYPLLSWDGSQLTPIPSLLHGIDGLLVYNNNLFAIGHLHKGIKQTWTPAMAYYNGSDWHDLEANQAVEGVFRDLEIGWVKFGNMVMNDGLLFVDSEWWVEEWWNGNAVMYGSELIFWDGNKFQNFGNPFSLKTGNQIQSLKSLNHVVYIGGGFKNEVLGTHSNGLVTWSDNRWATNSSQLDGVLINSMENFQNRLFLAGYFNGEPTCKIAVWHPE